MTEAEANAEALRLIAHARETNGSVLSLDLWNFGSLPLPQELVALIGLRELSLLNCKGLKDAGPLAFLTGLQTLSLDLCSVLSNLDPLAALTHLETLTLIDSDGPTDVSPLAALTGLRDLSLISCDGLKDLGPLGALTGLEKLTLSHCKCLAFEPLRRLLPHLHRLILSSDDFTDLPREAYEQKRGDNVLDQVRSFYADLATGAKADAEVKLFILGNGGVGKTQLRRRLCNLNFDTSVPTTHGVELDQFATELDGHSHQVRVNLWDFGGQDIYHGSHALFLDSHAVFVVLWHPGFESGAFEQGGVKMANRPLAYWLDYVRAAAGKDAVVLVVQARADQRGDEQLSLPPADLDGLRVRTLAVSAKTSRGLDVLQAELRLAVRDLLDARPPYQIGVGRAKVRDRVREMIADDQKCDATDRQHRTLSRDAFAELCAEVGGVSSSDALLTFLHRSGVVFYTKGLFHDQIVLDQQWALDAIYTMFDRTRVMPVFREHGRFTRTDLAHHAWQEHSADEQKLFLGMMEQCDICFKSGERQIGTGKEPVYVAPELLPDDRDTIRRVLAGRVPTGAPDAIATARFRFLHDGVLRSVLSRIGREFGDRATYWKWGVFLYDERTDSRAWLEASRGGWDDGPGGGTITVKVWGRQPGDVVAALMKVVNEAASRQQSPEWTTDDGRPAEPDYIVQAKRGDDPPAMKPGVPPDTKREVAISYGHGDATGDEKARNRGAFVDGVEPAMRAWGYRPLRDVNALTNCGLIRQFVLTLVQDQRGQPRRVVLVLTEKYLRSAYCMSELYAIYQFSIGNSAAFADRVVPCVIEADLNIDDWRGRKKWSDHWKAEYADMTATAEDLSADDKKLWHEIRQWVHVVPDLLTFVSNMVTTRGYDALTADGFAAVKRMLDRPDQP